MNAFITCLSFLCAFRAAGCAIECVVCYDRTSKSCSGVMKTCDEGTTHCQTDITQMIFFGMEPIYNIFKNCSTTDGEHKSAAYQWRTQNFTYQLVQTFCSSDACNKNDSDIEIPVQNSTENGLYCQACLDLNNTSCQPSGTVKCTGKLTNCIYFGGIGRFSVDPVAISYRGCITIERTQDFPPFPMGTLERLDHLEFIRASPIEQTYRGHLHRLGCVTP
ncbi:phospholipase A2 inhibitor and Ly6/PLAUR domain-containing protein-like [Lissotriton helveticus]